MKVILSYYCMYCCSLDWIVDASYTQNMNSILMDTNGGSHHGASSDIGDDEEEGDEEANIPDDLAGRS